MTRQEITTLAKSRVKITGFYAVYEDGWFRGSEFFALPSPQEVGTPAPAEIVKAFEEWKERRKEANRRRGAKFPFVVKEFRDDYPEQLNHELCKAEQEEYDRRIEDGEMSFGGRVGSSSCRDNDMSVLGFYNYE